MATLLLCLALQETRVTLELRDVPLREAAERALKPFGHTTEWIREPFASPRANLSLKDAGYFQALDAVCGLVGLAKVHDPCHNAVTPLMYCGNYLMGRRTLATVDLSADVRLIIVREWVNERETRLEFALLLPPGRGARPACAFEALRINGTPSPSPAEFRSWDRQEGYPTRLSFGLAPSTRKVGETIDLAGELVLEGVRRLPFQTERVVLPPGPYDLEPDTPGPLARNPLFLWIAGLAVIVGLLLAGLRRRATSRRS